jgi:hemerythrin-like domain-containing protein
MLVTFGARRGKPDGVDLLVECHGRIRRHLGFARRLAAGVGHPLADICDTARQVRRYFAEALPLHILDEEESVMELLAGRDADLDAALARMATEHMDHEPALERLLELCAELEDAPEHLEKLSAELAPLAAAIETGFLAHLDLEERVIFSALRSLAQVDRDELGAAIQRRRTASLQRKESREVRDDEDRVQGPRP